MPLSPRRSITMLTSEATLEESIQSENAMRKKDDKLWFDDGTIIIVAQDTEFRVYKGQLERRSEVFKDMSSFPQPTADCSNSPCPAVHVTDCARDWRHVLSLIYDPSDEQSPFPYQIDDRSHPTFELIAACVRLGHKYAITSTYQQAMRYLKEYFTTNLDVFLANCINFWYLPIPHGFTLMQAIGVVNLARLTSEHTLLPVALLLCCYLGSSIVDGFTYSDGERETLSAMDIGLCFAAKGRLVSATLLLHMIHIYEPLPAGGCKLEHCERARGLFSQSTIQRVSSYPTKPNPMMEIDYTVPGADAPQLCESCRVAMKERARSRQRENWKALPTMLGISVPGW